MKNSQSKLQEKSQSQSQSQSKKPRGRPKRSIGPTETHQENVNLDLGKQSAMDETSPAPVAVPKKRGRKPKNALAAAAAAAAATAKQPDDTPTKASEVTDDETSKENAPKKSDAKSDANDDTIEANDTSDANDSPEKAEKPPKLSLSERKLARKAETEAIIASGGRGKRTPKPNPKYLDEPAALASANKQQKDELDPAEHAAGEEGDDEMNQSSDERRNEGPLKKRMLQKVGIKSGPGRKPGKGTPGRKPGSGAAGFKRKLEVDIDIDDDHGRKLFLDAKRRFQNSPSGSDDDAQLKKSKSPVTDALAAKLRSKYPNDITVKRTVTVENKISPISRARQQLEKSKIAVEKDGTIELRKRKFTEETETSEDDLGLARGTSDQETSLQKNVINRRKTQHTKILSDDKVVRTLPSSASSSSSAAAPLTTQYVRKPIGLITKPINKSPLAQNQLTQIRSQGMTKTYSISPQTRIVSSGSNKPAILRQPPRILNSSLCKPTNKATVPSFVTKVVTKDDYEHDINKKRNNNIISSRSKENNVTSYVYTEKDGKIIPKKTIVQQISPQQQQKLIQQRKTVLPVVRTPATQQRIISEPVTMNIPNSRRIRKITCFETWYVIKMVDEQPKPEKSVLNLSLMQIGNEIKKIGLPSSLWTYKILLQKLPKDPFELRKAKANEKSVNAKSNADESKNEASKTENDTKSDEKQDKNKSTLKEEETSPTSEAESSEAPKDEKATKESAGDNKTDDDKSEEKEPDTGSSETPKDEKSTEKSSENDQKGKKSKKEDIKTDVKAESKSQDSTENESSDISAKETEEKKSDVDVKSESETQEVKKQEKVEEGESSESSQSHDVYSGEVHDPSINPNERHNYRPINIMFRRKCQNPQIRIQFDRTVVLKNQTFLLNVDGKNVRLVASPQSIETYDDIETLLQIVDHISLSNCCVEVSQKIENAK